MATPFVPPEAITCLNAMCEPGMDSPLAFPVPVIERIMMTLVNHKRRLKWN